MQFAKRYCDIGVYKKFENEEGEEDIEKIEDESFNTIENDFIIALKPHENDRLPKGSVKCEVDGKNYTMKYTIQSIVCEASCHPVTFGSFESCHPVN